MNHYLYMSVYRIGSGVIMMCILTGILCSIQEVFGAMNKNNESSGVYAVPYLRARKSVYLDGKGTDRAWARSLKLPDMSLRKGYKGMPAMSSAVRVFQAGQWLIIGCEAEETGGIIARESGFGKPMWYDDAFIIRIKGSGRISVMANPLGALYSTLNGRYRRKLTAQGSVQCASRIMDNRWCVEIAVDISKIAPGPDTPFSADVSVTRQRQARGCTEPFEESVIPAPGSKQVLSFRNGWDPGNTVSLDTAFPQRFRGRTMLDTGYSEKIPEDESGWEYMPAALLSPENGFVPLDEYFLSTEVRAAVTDKTIAFRIVCSETHPDSIQDAGKSIWSEDNIELFVGPERYRYIQFLCSPGGRITAAAARQRGGKVKGIQMPRGVVYKVQKDTSCWTAELSIPLDRVCAVSGAPKGLYPHIYPWVIQITRTRPGRESLGQPKQYSFLSVTRSSTSHCPLRFGGIRTRRIGDTPIPSPRLKKPRLPAPVLSSKQREKLGASSLLKKWIYGCRDGIHRRHTQKRAEISTLADWKKYAEEIRSEVMAHIFPARKGTLPERTPLRAEIVYDHAGDGFRYRGLIFQSRPGLYAAATLFIPEDGKRNVKRPALVIIPSQHTNRNVRDVPVTGANFARGGGIALTIESIGSGERLVTAAYRHKRQQRNLAGVQILLAGETLEGWTAWDISRCADYLLSRDDVDSKRIGILGGVAGGGDVSSLAAFIDSRFSVSIPFNFGGDHPIGGYCDSLRAYYGINRTGCTPWMLNALIAPRKVVQAQEFAWTDDKKQLQDMYKKVFGFFGKKENVTFLHGGPETHALHFAAPHRKVMYRILNEWFDMNILENGNEYTKYPKSSKLECFQSPAGYALMSRLRSENKAFEPYEIARIHARKRIESIRSMYKNDRGLLRKNLDALIGDTSPVNIDMNGVTIKDCGSWNGAAIQGVWLPAEPAGAASIGVSVWVCLPAGGKAKRPAVLGISQEGKARFLAERGGEIRTMLEQGIAVALVDVRGTGETSPGDNRLPQGPSSTLASEMWMLGDSMPARRLKDVRTVLSYLAGRDDIDEARIGLWGEGFSDPNGISEKSLIFNETGFRQKGPEPKSLAEPVGGLLALCAGLYPVGENNIKTVLCRGTLFSFMSVLEKPHHYIPMDAVIPGMLRVCDTADVVEALELGHVRVLCEDLRDGRNRVVTKGDLRKSWNSDAEKTYTPYPAHGTIERIITDLKRGLK